MADSFDDASTLWILMTLQTSILSDDFVIFFVIRGQHYVFHWVSNVNMVQENAPWSARCVATLTEFKNFVGFENS